MYKNKLETTSCTQQLFIPYFSIPKRGYLCKSLMLKSNIIKYLSVLDRFFKDFFYSLETFNK